MNIREVTKDDRAEWLRMRHELWPGSLSDHDADTRKYFDAPQPGLTTFVAEDGGALVGFLELDLRKYAPGCEESPIPFIEGWYVRGDARGQGVGRALVNAAEEWATAAGHKEIASDVEIDNEGSLRAHRALGYEEIERVAFFRKRLDA
jgi:aminoglycoside 6'-N-acetyltransferase I